MGRLKAHCTKQYCFLHRSIYGLRRVFAEISISKGFRGLFSFFSWLLTNKRIFAGENFNRKSVQMSEWLWSQEPSTNNNLFPSGTWCIRGENGKVKDVRLFWSDSATRLSFERTDSHLRSTEIVIKMYQIWWEFPWTAKRMSIYRLQP